MKILLAILLQLFQSEQAQYKWECAGDSKPAVDEQMQRLRPSELKQRVVACAIPHLPGFFDGQGTVIVEVQINEAGMVQCARVIGGAQNPIIRRAAFDAARQWKFKPLMVAGKAKPFVGALVILVSWNVEEAGKQCPKGKRKA